MNITNKTTDTITNKKNTTMTKSKTTNTMEKKEEKKEVVNAQMRGTFTTNLYEVEFESKLNPSENGLGFSTMVAAPSEEMARKWFQMAHEACEIREVEEIDSVICPFMALQHGMTLRDYQHEAMTTCMETSHNMEYMVLNLLGEVGELAEKLLPFCKDYNMRDNLGLAQLLGARSGKVAKQIRKGLTKVYEPMDVLKIPTFDSEMIHKELGDILWQLAGVCDVMEYPLNFVAYDNLEKLAARKKAGTIDGNGDGVSAEDGRKV